MFESFLRYIFSQETVAMFCVKLLSEKVWSLLFTAAVKTNIDIRLHLNEAHRSQIFFIGHHPHKWKWKSRSRRRVKICFRNLINRFPIWTEWKGDFSPCVRICQLCRSEHEHLLVAATTSSAISFERAIGFLPFLAGCCQMTTLGPLDSSSSANTKHTCSSLFKAWMVPANCFSRWVIWTF